jgi:hypothetical protein
MDGMNLDQFWREYAEGCAELVGVQTVEKVIDICYRRWGSSAGDAFFPGQSGDIELIEILLDAGWSTVWAEASYFYAIRQPGAVDAPVLTYIEGDVQRGNSKRPNLDTEKGENA